MDFKNPIWITSNIDAKVFFVNFTRRFSEIMQNSRQGDEMTVFIDSNGGDTETALGIYDLLKGCERFVVGLVSGRAESAAAIILQACSQRVMTKHSGLMIHKISITFNELSVVQAETGVHKYRRIDDRCFAIYRERTGRPMDPLFDEKYFTAEEALEAGLIDEIYG